MIPEDIRMLPSVTDTVEAITGFHSSIVRKHLNQTGHAKGQEEVDGAQAEETTYK